MHPHTRMYVYESVGTFSSQGPAQPQGLREPPSLGTFEPVKSPLSSLFSERGRRVCSCTQVPRVPLAPQRALGRREFSLPLALHGPWLPDLLDPGGRLCSEITAQPHLGIYLCEPHCLPAVWLGGCFLAEGTRVLPHLIKSALSGDCAGRKLLWRDYKYPSPPPACTPLLCWIPRGSGSGGHHCCDPELGKRL